jgi:bla regulator protein blaR1
VRVLEGGFLFIANMSLTAAYTALIIILFRGLFFKKLPKIFSYSLWGALLFRLLSPVSFGSAYSFFNLLKPQAQEGATVARYLLPNPTRLPLPLTVATGSGLEVEQTVRAATTTLLPEAAGTAVASAGSVVGAGLLQLLPSIAALIWVLGIAALIAHSIAAYIRVTTPVRTATLVRGILLSPELHVFFDTSRYKFPER